jgi:hypothetical protein
MRSPERPVDCKRLWTLGPPKRRKEFCYSGSIQSGVVLDQSGHPRIDARVFAEALKHFAGETVYGGFKEDDPTSGGLGEWLQRASPGLNSRRLTPRHGSFVAAILCAEGNVRHLLEGNAVVLHFPDAADK